MQRLFLSCLMGLAMVISHGSHAAEITIFEKTAATTPHIALLLPLKSSTFRAAASAVEQGFIAASKVEKPSIPVRVYGFGDENNEVVTTYTQALANGAQAVVGPLTRNGASLLAQQPNIMVPTLVLNTFETNENPLLYSFGMAVETEARLVAQQAAKVGLRDAIVISSMSPLDLRMQFAFEEEWRATGGNIVQEVEFTGDPAQLAGMTSRADTLIFLAGTAQQARIMRPYLPHKLPIYATSQIFSNYSPTNFELNGIHFVDMPWFIQPEHPAVRAYPHPNPSLSVDLERLYALGIDAYKLVQILMENQLEQAMPMHGVTGGIQLNGHQFLRNPIPAIFSQGVVQSPDEISTTTQLFPAVATNKP